MKLWVKIVPAIASNIPATPPEIANIVSSEGFPISIHKKPRVRAMASPKINTFD